MGLPPMAYDDNIKRVLQESFGGYNHTVAAKDGELWDMTNLTSTAAPVLSTRERRYLLTTLTKPNGIFAKDKLCWVDGTGFYYNGVYKGAVTDSLKKFAAIGPYIIILPDKAFYNTDSDIFGSLEATWSGGSLSFQNGTIYGETAKANTIYASGVTWSSYFKPGDGVTISGCTTYTQNNKTAIIREISGNYMRFSENIFTLAGASGTTDYTETGTLSVKRQMPDLDYILENENRLWGGKDDTIYASKLGDPFNFSVFDNISTDSYFVPTGSAGDFTAAKACFGYPVFFKPQHIHKVYGNMPSNFKPMGGANLGVMAGASESLAIASEVLYYLSGSGIVAYTGGIPTPMGRALGTERYKNGVAGSDGLKYYISMQDTADAWHLFVYDTQENLWHREDAKQVIGFAQTENLYMLDSTGKLWLIGSAVDVPESATQEAAFSWSAEFADFTDKEIRRRYLMKIQLRMDLEENATSSLYIQYDSNGTWIKLADFTETDKTLFVVPVRPRRADHYRLKLTGTGGMKLFAMAREYSTGSDSK